MIEEGKSLELLAYTAWIVWNPRNKGEAWFANKSGVGVVIRDSYGAVLASCLEKIFQAYKAEVTEALAARKALSFAHELGFQNVILEGDALGLIQALKSQEQNLCPLGLLVEYVKI